MNASNQRALGPPAWVPDIWPTTSITSQTLINDEKRSYNAVNEFLIEAIKVTLREIFTATSQPSDELPDFVPAESTTLVYCC